MTALLALLPMLLSLLSNQQTSSGGGSAGSPSGGAASISSNAGSLGPLSGLLGQFPQLASLLTESQGGANLNTSGGLEGAGIANVLGLPLLGGFFGSELTGLPTEAKTQGIGTALAGTGNPLDALISRFIGREVNAGNPLSSNTADNATRRVAAMIQALTGQRAPTATATGFQNNPTWQNPAMGKAIERFRLPAGYQFATDPSALQNIYKDVSGAVGTDASKIYGGGGEQDWQQVVRQLIQQGALTKYQGPLGAAGGGNTSGGAIPNVSLPHPLTNQANPAFAPAPYPT